MTYHCYLCGTQVSSPSGCESCHKNVCPSHSNYASGKKYCSACLKKQTQQTTTTIVANKKVGKKRCPHCDELISETVSRCPFCAEPIGGKIEPIQPQTASDSVTESIVSAEGIKPIKPVSSSSDESLKNKMSRLNDLLADRLITQKEYDDKKKQLLNKYLDV